MIIQRVEREHEAGEAVSVWMTVEEAQQLYEFMCDVADYDTPEGVSAALIEKLDEVLR